MFKSQKGFTLIELLVVIAIIGILSAVVLASLNQARMRGADASITATINGVRAQAALHFDGQDPNSFAGLCGTGSPTTEAEASVNRIGQTGAWTCVVGDAGDTYAVSGRLVTDSTRFYCVDSTGAARITAGSAALSGTAPNRVAACPPAIP